MKAQTKLVSVSAFLSLAVFWANTSMAAVDSYRYLHVSVETPYTIFLFLLMGILAPFILMLLLVWRFVFFGRKSGADGQVATIEQQEEGRK